MSNKKLHLVFGLVLTMLIGTIGNFTSAVRFRLDFDYYGQPARWEFISKNMTPIHFTDNGNDFGGFIYFSNGIVEEEETLTDLYYVQAGNDIFECQQKVKGFYYNAERGERLWPLDGIYQGVSAEDGMYTRCRKEGYSEAMASCAGSGSESKIEKCENNVRKEYVDSHGYYGMVTHNYGGQKFVLVAGTNYLLDDTLNIGNNLDKTLIRFDNKYPVGFIYDVNGGVGFLGCKMNVGSNAKIIFNDFLVDGSSDWTNLFSLAEDGKGLKYKHEGKLDCTDMGSAMNSLISVIVDGLVGINRDPGTGNMGIQGNQSNDKMQYFGSVDINNMQLINYAKQKADILCRGKWKKFNNNYDNPLESLYCFDDAVGNIIPARTGTTIIVKDKDVKVTDMNDFMNGGNYDIFVDDGDLIIEEVTDGELQVFKKNGFILNNDVNAFKEEVYENAWGNDKPYSGENVVAGKFIKGNFIINGNIKASTDLSNVYFIYGKMTSKDTVDSLKDVFKRKCNNGTGSDGIPCPGGWAEWNNPYENASLVIIDQNYPSPLYQ